MKTALITTTINVPTVLSLYRKLDPDVRFFVAGDHRTPEKAWEFCPSVGADYYAPFMQEKLGYACSGLIGWNTKSRRNIAMLEALRWGADVVVVIDDDNIPVTRDYFSCFTRLFGAPFSGIKVGSGGWFDPGQWQYPDNNLPVVQRGFPQGEPADLTVSHITNACIGAAQGLCIGDPDTSAVDRISKRPVVHRISELLRAGVVVDKAARTVCNSQNTAIARRFVPAFFLPTHLWQRYDDIFAGLVLRRVMREHNAFLHVGPPVVWQARNPHDDLIDLKSEIWGMEHILGFASWLDGFPAQSDVIGMLRVMATSLPEFIPRQTQEVWLAWLDDCERVMK